MAENCFVWVIVRASRRKRGSVKRAPMHAPAQWSGRVILAVQVRQSNQGTAVACPPMTLPPVASGSRLHEMSSVSTKCRGCRDRCSPEGYMVLDDGWPQESRVYAFLTALRDRF